MQSGPWTLAWHCGYCGHSSQPAGSGLCVRLHARLTCQHTARLGMDLQRSCGLDIVSFNDGGTTITKRGSRRRSRVVCNNMNKTIWTRLYAYGIQKVVWSRIILIQYILCGCKVNKMGSIQNLFSVIFSVFGEKKNCSSYIVLLWPIQRQKKEPSR